jgi:hypothetical protein
MIRLPMTNPFSLLRIGTDLEVTSNVGGLDAADV